MKSLTILVLILLASVQFATAQQWTGSSTTTGTIYRSGNVGIGPLTTIPGFASIYLNNGGGLNPNIMFRNSDAPANNRVWAVMAQGGRFRIITQNDSYSSVQDAFVIERSGINVTNVTFPFANVGIGLTSPSSMLHVASDIQWGTNGSKLTTNQGGSIELRGTGTTPYIDFSNDASSDFDMRLILTGNNSLNIDGGNVGIGTSLSSNPNSYKLAVNGKIGAKEVQVENTSATWADYVFEADYNLISLDDVENFIKINKHLPEVPSKNDVETNGGHNLGEMDVLLLKKIEELTLYMIQLKKEIDLVKLENKELLKTIKSSDSN